MNIDLEQQMAAMQQRLDELERSARQTRTRRTLWVVVVALAAGSAMGAATWPANFQAGAPAKAVDLNDYFNDLNTRVAAASPRVVPTGAVMFFNLGACPAGWTAFTPARGRTVVGLNSGGTLGTTVGNPIPNGVAPAHSHRWSRFSSAANWYSFNDGGVEFQVINWSNGLNEGTGTGYFPFGPDAVPGSDTHFFTTLDQSGLAYVQLLACSKD
ncbi:MAG: hypothetical protein GQE15_26610 [Archangiaceae bacterium]|nr:hypothetical protein [Archangiaceae bacterium]